jgi:hypothetical protein
MTEPQPTDRQRLAALRTTYHDLRPRVVAGEPWPLAKHFGTEPEASWGPREVLAHVAEMLPFWLGELDRIVLDRGHDPVPFGRMADDHLRIGLIERDRTLPLAVLFGGIDTGLHDWELRLATLSAADLAKVGRHVRLGEMPASDIAERFCLGHAEEHAAQLESILAAAGR